MPAGVLSYIRRRVHTKLLLLPLLLALKTELPIKYSTVHMGGNTQACCLPARLLLLLLLEVESRLGPKLPIITCIKVLHVSRINTGTNRHDRRYAGTPELSGGCLILLHFSSRMSLFDAVCVCVCVVLFPL